MEIKEAIERYTSNAEYERTHGSLQGCLEFRQLAEWLKDYKRLLEQEPNTDAVSRQAILDKKVTIPIAPILQGEEVHCEEVVFVNDILTLPPVTPTRPKGQWIQKEGIYGVSFCDRCNFELTINDTNFCPNCGQDMREGEE